MGIFSHKLRNSTKNGSRSADSFRKMGACAGWRLMTCSLQMGTYLVGSWSCSSRKLKLEVEVVPVGSRSCSSQKSKLFQSEVEIVPVEGNLSCRKLKLFQSKATPTNLRIIRSRDLFKSEDKGIVPFEGWEFVLIESWGLTPVGSRRCSSWRLHPLTWSVVYTSVQVAAIRVTGRVLRIMTSVQSFTF